MSSAQAAIVYRDRDQIISDLMEAWQTRIPDVNLGIDSVVRIWCEVFGYSMEGLYLAIQLLYNDMFVTTASALALERFGDQFDRPRDGGTLSSGVLRFSGAEGAQIPLGLEVLAPQLDEDLVFRTIGTTVLPSPGSPLAPAIAAGAAGTITGTMEYAVTFTTLYGQTQIGDPSAPLVVAAKQVAVTAIPLGGPGTTSRKIYRRKNGGAWQFVFDMGDNTTTTYTDNVVDGSLGGAPPDDSTAIQAEVPAQSDDVGAKYNVGAAAITEIRTSTSGVTGVTNPSFFSGGSEPEETEAFRSGILEAIRAPRTGSLADLEYWAKVIPGIEIATAFKNSNLGTPTNGHTSVYVGGANGSTPTGPQVADVQAALDAIDAANAIIHVAAFTPVAVNVTVSLTLDIDHVLADVTDMVQQAIENYINTVPVHGSVYVAGIIDAVFGLPGIKTLSVSVPATTVTTATTEKAVAGTITVT